MDRPSLEALIDEHYPRILRAALVLTGRGHDAEDLAQETFLHAMDSWTQFEARSRVDTWLYGILINRYRKGVRSRKRGWRRMLKWFRSSNVDAGGAEPSQPLEEKEWRQSLWAAVNELPARQREALVLRYSEELAYDQIAEVLGCPVGTVKSRLHHGLAKLREQLQRDSHAVDNLAARSTQERRDVYPSTESG